MTPADIEGFLRQHKDLEKAISSHDWWLGVFTIIVALGIFAETMVEFGYSKDKPRSEKWLTLLCALVVLGGVVGEYCEGDKVVLTKLASSNKSPITMWVGYTRKLVTPSNVLATQRAIWQMRERRHPKQTQEPPKQTLRLRSSKRPALYQQNNKLG